MKNSMPNATKFRRFKKLEREGWNVDYHDEGVYLHGENETPKHLTLKAMVALKLRQKGRPFETEATLDGKGRVDVLDWGPVDGKAIAYEVETQYSRERAIEKAEQYSGGVVRDVIVIPVLEAPDEPAAILEWLDEYIV